MASSNYPAWLVANNHQTARIERTAGAVVSMPGRLDLEGSVLDATPLPQQAPDVMQRVLADPAGSLDLTIWTSLAASSAIGNSARYRACASDCAPYARECTRCICQLSQSLQRRRRDRALARLPGPCVRSAPVEAPAGGRLSRSRARPESVWWTRPVAWPGPASAPCPIGPGPR